jgi:hypothetical protein
LKHYLLAEKVIRWDDVDPLTTLIVTGLTFFLPDNPEFNSKDSFGDINSKISVSILKSYLLIS